jgi:hypothetical protein
LAKKKLKWFGIVVGAVAVLVLILLFTNWGRRAQFVIGGAMVNLGFRMQDHLESYDFEHEHNITPEQIWNEIVKQNHLAAGVRKVFPRTARHPLVAMVVCMDARIDTSELAGDTRRYYYVIRTAGSVLSEREEEMLELAAENGVKLILLTTHSDCAAEKAASTEESRKQYPALAQAVDERDERIREFLARPAIASRIESGELAVKLVHIDTMTDEILPK